MGFLKKGEHISCLLCESSPGRRRGRNSELKRYSRATDFAQHVNKTHHRVNWRNYAIIEDWS